MAHAGQFITPSNPSDQDCFWCGKPALRAYLPNRKGAATFNYVCGKHTDQAERAGWEECVPGVARPARQSTRRAS